MKGRRTRRVVFQPGARQGIQRGIQQIVDAVRPTLGPLPRQVAFHQLVANKMPEMLTKGGVIARRIIALPDRDEDMGAMLARHMLWRLHENYGDGTATAAILLADIYNQGVTYITAGGNAIRLRHFLEAGQQLILNELDAQTVWLTGKQRLAALADSVCGDPPLARLLGEIFDIIGEHGQLEIRPLRSRELQRDYLEGMAWKAQLFSRDMYTDRVRLRTQLEDAAVLITDLRVDEANQLVPALEAAAQAGRRSLLVIAAHLAPAAIALLLLNSRDPERFQAVAVRTPGPERSDEIAALEDLAVLTGGRPFVQAAGDTLTGVTAADLGRARRVWVDRERFGVIGGRGDPRRLRTHVAALRQALALSHDADTRRRLQERIGQLMSGVATLRVGGPTEVEIETRKRLAEETAGALRAAIRSGVLPGGGAALLACRPLLRRQMDVARDPDERAAYRILSRAVEAPARTIAQNAGYDASEVIAGLRSNTSGMGFDVLSGQAVNMEAVGILDVAEVHKAAVIGAIATAATALTIDVLVHHKKPAEATEP
jgi:chaperonin GroEL